MKFSLCTVALVSCVSAFNPNAANTKSLKMDDVVKVAVAGCLAVGINVCPANALTRSEIDQLSYLQVKGTGLANRCPEVKGEDSITPKSGSRLVDLCIEPKAWAVEEEIGKAGKTEKKFVNSKVMTRQTYTLEGIEGSLKSDGGNIVFSEEEGIDYAPTTVQLPGGERVPFLFTVKELVAKGNGGSFKPGFQMGGDFSVPSYRTGLFLDPKGRGMTTGYDQAQALAVSQTGVDGQAELENEINKVFDVFDGTIEFAVSNVNAADGEIGGVFVSSQASDTDLGSKTPKKVLSKGIFYGRITKE